MKAPSPLRCFIVCVCVLFVSVALPLPFLSFSFLSSKYASPLLSRFSSILIFSSVIFFSSALLLHPVCLCFSFFLPPPPFFSSFPLSLHLAVVVSQSLTAFSLSLLCPDVTLCLHNYCLTTAAVTVAGASLPDFLFSLPPFSSPLPRKDSPSPPQSHGLSLH